MKKLLFAVSFIFFLFFFFGKNPASAEDRCEDWSFTDENGKDIEPAPPIFYKSIDKINYTFKVKDADKDPGATYNIRLCQSLGSCSDLLPFDQTNNNKVVDANNAITGTFTNILNKTTNPPSPFYDHFEVLLNGGVEPLVCSYNINWKEAPFSQSAECELTLTPRTNIQPKDEIKISGIIKNVKGIKDYSIYKEANITNANHPVIEIRGEFSKDFRNEINLKNGTKEFSANLSKDWRKGSYIATAKLYVIDLSEFLRHFIPVRCSISFKVPSGVIPTATPFPTPTTPAICNDKSARDDKICSGEYDNCPWCPGYKRRKLGVDVPPLKPLCDQLGGEFSGKCWDCQRNGKKLWTAIGCIPINYTAFISEVVLKTGVGIAGGIAFLYFLYGVFIILTSTGNAEKLEEAKQIITSALAGLILIIFSIFLLKTIGVDILKLPGFG